jgi:hypothetical protein
LSATSAERYAVPVTVSRRAGFGGAVAALVLATILTGCSAPVSAPTESTPATGGTSTSPGTDVGVPNTLPDNFPADFPLIDGEIIVGLDLGTGWSVWIASDDPEADFETASNELVAAGYTSESSTTSDTGSFAVFSKDEYSVQLSAGTDPTYGDAVSYTIYRTQ